MAKYVNKYDDGNNGINEDKNDNVSALPDQDPTVWYSIQPQHIGLT